MMKVFNKRWVSMLAGLVLVSQSGLVSAALISDYALEFSTVDAVSVGESFDVDVFLDIAEGTELTTFGFNFDNAFTNLSFDSFSVPSWIEADLFNGVGGLADIFGPSGDNIQIATLHFTALSDGTENVSAYGEFVENGGGAYFYNYVTDDFLDGSLGGSFSVKVPEPSSIALMLLGVCGLAGLRKAKK